MMANTTTTLISVIVMLCGCPAPKSLPPPQQPPPTVVAWLIGGQPGLDSLQRNLAAVTVASPAYYQVTHDGDATQLTDWDPGNPVDRKTVRRLTRQGHVALLPLVACLGPCAGRMSATLRNPGQTRAHVEAILTGVAPDETDGVFVDYEGLTCSASDFNRFIDQLAGKLHGQGKRLGLAITEPCGISADCRREVYPFDIPHLAQVADHLSVMEYDYTVDGSDAVAPRAWVLRGLQRVRREVGSRRHKVQIGIPFYGRITAGLTRDTGVLWSEVEARRIQGQPLRIKHQAFDADKLSQVAQVTVGDRSGRLFYDDHTTLSQRLKLVREQGFDGIAIWRLGGEDPGNWGVIRGWIAGR